MDREHTYPNRRSFLKTITSAAVGASLLSGSRLLKADQFSLLRSFVHVCLQPEQINPQELVRKLTTSRYEINPFLGTSAAIQRLEQDARKIVATEQPILIEGEMGTGKGVLARWIHRSGPRAKEAFVENSDLWLNFIAVSDRARRLKDLLNGLSEPELFGYEKGAFTSGNRPGLVEMANRGVLFLDAIGEMDRMVQPKLLKVLEDKRFRRLGEVRERSTDIQVIAATSRDLKLAAKEMKFREDLYYRISTLRLRIPPLRERVEDIPVLANSLMCSLASDLAREQQELSKAAEAELKGHSWPGNIRELRNVLERVALVCDNRMIEPRDLGLERSTPIAQQPMSVPDLTLAELERWRIAEVLEEEEGNVARAAVRLGIPAT